MTGADTEGGDYAHPFRQVNRELADLREFDTPGPRGGVDCPTGSGDGMLAPAFEAVRGSANEERKFP